MISFACNQLRERCRFTTANCVLFAFLLFPVLHQASLQAQSFSDVLSYRADRLLIGVKKGVATESINRLHSSNQCRVVVSFPAFGNLQLLSLSQGFDVSEMLRRYQLSGLVDYAEPDYRVRLDNAFPNDPGFLDGMLWGLNNAGQSGGLPNADIDAPEAWGAPNSASNVIVAVVDTGIRYSHQDLAGNMWLNPWDGSHGTNALAGSTAPLDDSGHGTRIAGVIGAMGNNALGTVGVAWRVQLMACKFFGSSGGTISDALACLDFARSNGAQIINASWGLDEFSLSLSNAMAALRAAGILVVAAAGNDSRDIDIFPHFPASYNLDNIIAVTATTRQDELYGLSNIGATNVDLAAPGSEIYSTDFESDTAYTSDDGTSLATAYVSGAAALLRADHPTETPAQIINRMLMTVDSLPGLEGKCVSGGRLNLRKALSVPVSAPLLKASLEQGVGGFVVEILGDPGRYYVVEASTNLVGWSPLTTNLTGLNGAALYTNSPAAGRSQFFRARSTP